MWMGKLDLNTLHVDMDIFESAKKILWIQKYPDVCGWNPIYRRLSSDEQS